jgi:hypothetical protein
VLDLPPLPPEGELLEQAPLAIASAATTERTECLDVMDPLLAHAPSKP